MDLRPGPSFYPLFFWLPLAGALLAVQLGCVRFLLRPGRRQWARTVIAFVAADALLVLLLRVCVGAMGGMDYSAHFTTWRWWFLAAGVILIGLPLPFWGLALRAAGVGAAAAGSRPLLAPRFSAALAMWVLSGLVTLALGGDFTSWPRPAHLTRREVSIANLPRALNGLTIAVLTDLHTGDLVTPAALSVRLRPLAREKPDLLVVLGDVTALEAPYQRAAARVLQPYVVAGHSFAVAGNFDSGAGTDTLREELARVGVALLENESARVRVHGREVVIAGLGDAWTDNGDLEQTLASVPHGAPVILLSHTPDIIGEAAACELPLVLSGHTHGGQIVFPFAGPAVGMSRFGTRFAAGAWRVGKTALVVSRGLGEESLPLRLFCPPEIVLLRLHAAPDRR